MAVQTGPQELTFQAEAALAGKVADVRATSRLSDSPACNQAVLFLGVRIDDPAAFVDQLGNLLLALAVPLPAGHSET